MISKNQKEKIVQYFKNQPSVKMVFLFGSTAKNEQTPMSDIDLAVVFSDRNQNRFSLQGMFIEELNHRLETKVDVVNMNATDIAFNYRVLTEGILLYQRNPEEKVRLQIDLTKRYFDLKPTYDRYYRELTNRARAGTVANL